MTALASIDARGRLQSEGHRQFRLATRWDAGEGKRDTLDVLCAQLREAGIDVKPSSISAILNRLRAPSLHLAGAIERAWGVPAASWSLAPLLAANSESSTDAGAKFRVAKR